MRRISPPLETIPVDTPAPLGKLLHILNATLPEAWEFYWKPHLSGLYPELVLLNSSVGVAVLRVAEADDDRDGSARRARGEPSHGQITQSLERLKREQVAIAELYCPRLDRGAGITDVSAVLVCASMPGRVAREYVAQLRIPSPAKLAVLGADDLNPEGIRRSLPWVMDQDRDFMSEAVAKDLRHWLIEPDVSESQRSPLPVSDEQRKLIQSRTDSGFRRIRGPAGSGKSLVLAARASQLITEDRLRNVLVISYNITLLHYLMDLATRWPHPGASTRDRISWFSFHRWCRYVCEEAGRIQEYKDLWRALGQEIEVDPESGSSSEKDQLLEEGLPSLVGRILNEDTHNRIRRYDAVLVDEGQDFRPSWWEALRKVLRPGGEMLLVADFAQDVYGTAGTWTDEAMAGAGFSGRWVTLEGSYRLPPEVAETASRFARLFLGSEPHETPQPAQLRIPGVSTKLRWSQVHSSQAVDTCVDEILNALRMADPEIMSFADVTFLTSSRQVGERVAERLNRKGIGVIHTFGRTERESRRLKQAFVMGVAKVKATTIHSFKGWESRAVVIYIGQASTRRGRALLFSAITRVKVHPKGNHLAVVCGERSLRKFGLTWPEFRDRQTAERIRRS